LRCILGLLMPLRGSSLFICSGTVRSISTIRVDDGLLPALRGDSGGYSKWGGSIKTPRSEARELLPPPPTSAPLKLIAVPIVRGKAPSAPVQTIHRTSRIVRSLEIVCVQAFDSVGNNLAIISSALLAASFAGLSEILNSSTNRLTTVPTVEGVS
jgi:hypothetical protein